MTTNRAVALIGFVACAGITGVWGLITPERLYTFFLAAAVVFFINLKLSGNAPRDDGIDPEKIRSTYTIAYSQGVKHGIEQARVASGGGAHRTHARKGSSSGGLPRVG